MLMWQGVLENANHAGFMIDDDDAGCIFSIFFFFLPCRAATNPQQPHTPQPQCHCHATQFPPTTLAKITPWIIDWQTVDTDKVTKINNRHWQKKKKKKKKKKSNGGQPPPK
jgi:hypothetical protein